METDGALSLALALSRQISVQSSEGSANSATATVDPITSPAPVLGASVDSTDSVSSNSSAPNKRPSKRWPKGKPLSLAHDPGRPFGGPNAWATGLNPLTGLPSALARGVSEAPSPSSSAANSTFDTAALTVPVTDRDSREAVNVRQSTRPARTAPANSARGGRRPTSSPNNRARGARGRSSGRGGRGRGRGRGQPTPTSPVTKAAAPPTLAPADGRRASKPGDWPALA